MGCKIQGHILLGRAMGILRSSRDKEEDTGSTNKEVDCLDREVETRSLDKGKAMKRCNCS